MKESGNERQCGAQADGFRIYECLCASRRLDRLGKGRLADGAQVRLKLITGAHT